MQKNKLLISIFVYLFVLAFSATPVEASVLSIQSLPSYINTNNFKLSCTSDGGTVQFEYSKHGGAFMSLGSPINTDSEPCIVQVNSSVVGEQTDYTFRVGGMTTSTIYDASGPSPVSGYSKERVGDGEYKLRWRNPTDTDFDKVIIYRGDVVDFPADAGHEIARVNGSPNVDLSYNDHFAPDAGKTYFYAIRALDHAGNSSSLAGDGSLTVTTVTKTASPVSGSGKVTILPNEGTGSVLGSDASASSAPESTGGLQSSQNTPQGEGFIKWILTHKKISLGVLAILIAIGYFVFKKGNR